MDDRGIVLRALCDSNNMRGIKSKYSTRNLATFSLMKALFYGLCTQENPLLVACPNSYKVEPFSKYVSN